MEFSKMFLDNLNHIQQIDDDYNDENENNHDIQDNEVAVNQDYTQRGQAKLHHNFRTHLITSNRGKAEDDEDGYHDTFSNIYFACTKKNCKGRLQLYVRKISIC
jgi:hypothetical protein